MTLTATYLLSTISFALFRGEWNILELPVPRTSVLGPSYSFIRFCPFPLHLPSQNLHHIDFVLVGIFIPTTSCPGSRVASGKEEKHTRLRLRRAQGTLNSPNIDSQIPRVPRTLLSLNPTGNMSLGCTQVTSHFPSMEVERGARLDDPAPSSPSILDVAKRFNARVRNDLSSVLSLSCGNELLPFAREVEFVPHCGGINIPLGTFIPSTIDHPVPVFGDVDVLGLFEGLEAAYHGGRIRLHVQKAEAHCHKTGRVHSKCRFLLWH